MNKNLKKVWEFRCIVSLVILIITISLITVIPKPVKAVGQPVVILEWISSPEQIANVSPGSTGIVTFQGTVSGDMSVGSNVQTIIVTLNVTDDNGWSCVISPYQFNIQPNVPMPFEVNVRVPIGANFCEIDTIYVTAQGVTYPGATPATVQPDPLNGVIHIKQYYKFQLSCDQPYKEIEMGSKAEYNLTIRNVGNGRDTFRINITNLNNLTRDGFNVGLSTPTIAIDSNDSDTVKITVQSPEIQIESSKLYTIYVEVKSIDQEMNEGTSKPQTFELNLRVKPNAESPPDENNAATEKSFVFDSKNSKTVATAATGIGLLITIILMLFTEVGKYNAMIFFMPLYSRLNEKDILNNEVRGEILGYLKARPGVSYSGLQSNLKLKNGTLTYHLSVLEREGHIKSKRDGVNKKFYPMGMKISQSRIDALNETQKKILEAIKTNPGLTRPILKT